MIRRAVPADIPAIVELAIEALRQGAYENMVINREKVEAMVRVCLTSPPNFAWIAEHDGQIGGAVGALVHECMFYDRIQATVVMFFCKIRGEGVKLLREFLRWARARPAIKLIAFSLEYDADQRIEILLKRLGLTKALPAFIETR